MLNETLTTIAFLSRSQMPDKDSSWKTNQLLFEVQLENTEAREEKKEFPELRKDHFLYPFMLVLENTKTTKAKENADG